MKDKWNIKISVDNFKDAETLFWIIENVDLKDVRNDADLEGIFNQVEMLKGK